jgi:hypothetical protein
MKKQMLQHFFIGVLIAFTISIIILSAIMVFTSEDPAVSVHLIWQVFILSVLCSLINLVYCSEKLKFIWQSVIGYLLTTATIMICGLTFDWYGSGGNNFNKTNFIVVSFFIYSLFYLFTWMIIWKITKLKKKELNDKLREYKERQ